MMQPGSDSAVAMAVGIVVGAFVSEDGATVAAATLAASRTLSICWAFLSAVLGLWIGDMGVYAFARVARGRFSTHPRIARWLPDKLSASQWCGQSHLALGLSRFLPGTRLPAYVAAGLSRMPVAVFAATTAVSAALWSALIFVVIHLFPAQVNGVSEKLLLAGLAGLVLFMLLAAWRAWGNRLRARLIMAFRRCSRWEFWPAWAFYPPVALMCGWLALRFRGFSLPTVANPSQRNGGIVGESKMEILRDLMRSSPDVTADACLIAPGDAAARMEQLQALCAHFEISVPFVLKPDTAQRGAGFRKTQSWEEAQAYLAQVNSPVVLQRYVEGPEEAGIFYYRFPGETTGQIFSITRKEFPWVTGDGKHTLEELIRQDERASLIAHTYLERFRATASRVIPEGERVRLVEAGNHCQGCIFGDGADLYSEELRSTFDRISQALPGFFIGRFDIRYQDRQELLRGAGFKIIELNGAASEATDIYDARNSLWSAYKTLYRQWKLVYAIGAANRDRGYQPASPWEVWRDWKRFRQQAACYPLAD